jgi:hypothetical protein
VVLALSRHCPPGHPPEVLVDYIEKAVSGFLLPCLDLLQQERDLCIVCQRLLQGTRLPGEF